MTPEHQLIQQIAQLTDSDQLERSPVLEEFADQFAELCHETNARLQRCAEYLDKGMRSEAVHEAQSPPVLLDMVKALQFDGLRKWRNICADLELEQCPPLATEVVERLEEECRREQDLAPLLKEYRRYVYQGNREKCIQLLRELREKDPANPSWPENLRPLEEAQLPSLLDETRDALDGHDLAHLRELNHELAHPQRVVMPPADIMAEVKHELLAERRKETALQGDRLSRQIAAAAEQEDGEKLTDLFEQWSELKDDEAFQPTEHMRERVESARDWFGTYRQKEAERAEFQALVDDTWEMLGTKPAPADILRRRQELQDQPYTVPEALLGALDEALQGVERRRRARRRLLSSVVFLAVVAALLAGAVIWRSKQIGARRTRMLARMEELARESDIDELNAYLKAVSERDAEFYNAPEVRHIRDDVDQALQLRDQKQREFQNIMDQLNRVRADTYAVPEENIQRLLAEAAEILPDDDARQTLSAWRQAYEQWKDRKLQRATKELERVVVLVRRILEQKQRKPFASFEAEEGALSEARPLLEEGKSYLNEADSKMVEAYNALVVQIDVWQRDLAERRKAEADAQRKLQELRRAIPRALPDLAQYRNLVSEFVKSFPEQPETDSYRRTLDYLPAWTAAVALQDFEIHSLPGAPDLADRIRTLFDSTPALKGSAWEPDLERCLAYLDANDAVRAKIPLLLVSKSETLNLQVTYYRPKGEQEWKPLYSPKPLASRTETDDDGNEYKLYWGQVYYFEQKTDKPWLIHTSKVFPNNLNTKDFDVRVEKRIQDNLVGHGKFLYRFVADATDAREMDVHVLNGIKRLLVEDELPLVPRAWLLKRLTHFLFENFGDTIAESRNMVALVDKMDTDAPWMNPQHPDVLAAEKEIRSLLPQFPEIDPIVVRLRTQRAVLAAALSRKVRCIGSMQPDGENAPNPYWVGSLAQTVWILTANSPGTRPAFKIAAKRREGGGILFSGTSPKEHFVGQLLLAPGDANTAKDLLETILPDPQLKNQLQKPASWPSNAW